MRSTQLVRRSALAIAGAALLLVLGGCPNHENLPTELALVEAPAPGDFTVTAQGFNSGTGMFEYDLTWTISDVSIVDRYRLYLVGGGFLPQLVYETTDDDESQLRIGVALPDDAEGLQFGLSTVSTGNVESSIAVAVIPPLPPAN